VRTYKIHGITKTPMIMKTVGVTPLVRGIGKEPASWSPATKAVLFVAKTSVLESACLCIPHSEEWRNEQYN
jgi:hypothetical protein